MRGSVVPGVDEGVAGLAEVVPDLCGCGVHCLGDGCMGVAVESEGDGGCLVGCEAGHHLYLFQEGVFFVAHRQHGVEGAAVGEVVEFVEIGVLDGAVEGVLHNYLCPGVEADECGWVGCGACGKV